VVLVADDVGGIAVGEDVAAPRMALIEVSRVALWGAQTESCLQIS
jgi:hypothetical protein